MAQMYYDDELPLSGTSTTVQHHHRRRDHHDHGHHHNTHVKEVVVSNGDGGWAVWLVCAGIGTLLLVFFIIAAVGLGQSNTTQSHVNFQMAQIREEIEAQQSQLVKSDSRMVLTSAIKQGKQRQLCALQSYYSKKGEALLQNGDRLEPLTQTIGEIREGEMKSFYYYHVSARVRLSMGQDKAHREYLTVDHNITSNFARFSSIRLEELEFNTLDQSLGPMRSIALCTNNPFLDVQRCDASLTKRNILALHGHENVPLLITLQQQPANTMHQEQTIKLNPNEDDDSELEEASGGDDTPDRLHRRKQRREVIGLRMYNVVFYQSEEVKQIASLAPSVTKQRIHGSSTMDDAASYKERRVLTLDLAQC